jgi:hypothetical protein
VDPLQAGHPQALGIEAREEEGRQVIAHIVLFRPRAALSASERDALLDALQHVITDIAAIKRSFIGKRILLDRPGYEKQMAEHFEYSAILEFDSEADLRGYLDHPSHGELGRRLFSAAEAVLAYDFISADPKTLI